MLLQKVLNENVVSCLYESSNILASKYFKDTKKLIITFKRGVTYTYSNVPEKDYLRFEMADSQGQILSSHIKQYPTVKGDNVDANLIVEEINNVKKQEVISIESDLNDVLVKLVNLYETEKTFAINDLDILIKVIERVKEIKS